MFVVVIVIVIVKVIVMIIIAVVVVLVLVVVVVVVIIIIIIIIIIMTMCTPPMQPTQPPFTWLGDFILFRSELLHSLSVVGAFSLRECLFSPIEFSLQHLILSTSSPPANLISSSNSFLQLTPLRVHHVLLLRVAETVGTRGGGGRLSEPELPLSLPPLACLDDDLVVAVLGPPVPKLLPVLVLEVLDRALVLPPAPSGPDQSIAGRSSRQPRR